MRGVRVTQHGCTFNGLLLATAERLDNVNTGSEMMNIKACHQVLILQNHQRSPGSSQPALSIACDLHPEYAVR